MRAPTPQLDDRLAFSVAESATKLGGISRAKVYELLASGALEARKLGGRTIILRDELVRYLESLPTYKAEGDQVA